MSNGIGRSLRLGFGHGGGGLDEPGHLAPLSLRPEIRIPTPRFQAGKGRGHLRSVTFDQERAVHQPFAPGQDREDEPDTRQEGDPHLGARVGHLSRHGRAHHCGPRRTQACARLHQREHGRSPAWRVRANAEHNFNLNRDDLVLKQLLIDEGPTFRRRRPVSRSMAHEYFHRTCHITAVVEDQPEPQKTGART